MNQLQESLTRLRRFNAWVRRSDPELAEESLDLGRAEVLEVAESPQAIENAVTETASAGCHSVLRALVFHRHGVADRFGIGRGRAARRGARQGLGGRGVGLAAGDSR